MEKVFQFIKQFSSKEVLQIYINWGTILTFVCFWMYGVYGFLSIPTFTIGTHIVVSFLLLGMLVYIYQSGRVHSFLVHATLTGRDILVFISYLIVMMLVFWKALFTDIDGDQLYHAQQAMMHALVGTQFIGDHLSSLFGSVPFSYVMWGINIGVLFLSSALFLLIKNWKSTYVLVLLSCAFLLARFATIYEGGNGSAFPVFRLFPLWITGTLFSPSSFSFRLATFLGLLILMFFVYKYVSKRFSFAYAFIFGLFVGTIPVLLHVGTLVEMSLWAAFCLLVALFTVNSWCEGEKIHYISIISVIVVLSCMRVSGFITLVPIVGMLMFDFLHKKIQIKEVVYSLSPILVLLPVIFASVYIGTPASYHGLASLEPYVPSGTGLLGRLYIALDGGYFFTHIYNSIRFPLLLVLAVLPLLLLRNMKKLLLVGGLFVLYFILFYSIEPGLWGNGRYQAEYAVPFIIYSMCLFGKEVWGKYKVALLVLCIGVISNLYLYSYASELNKASYGQDVYFNSMKKRGEYFIWSELPYNFKEALGAAKEEGFAGRVYYSPGNGYGYFSEILSGYTVEETQKQKSIISHIGVGISSSTAHTIHFDNNVGLVLVNGSGNNKETLNEQMVFQLKKYGWVKWKEFKNEEYQTVLSGFIRSK